MTRSHHSLLEIHDRLRKSFGPQQWWPADTPFEVIVGAILTQNTAWTNVERAIANLKAAEVLSPQALCCLAIAELERLIRPSGFFRQKAARLRQVTSVLVADYGGSVDRFCSGRLDEARERLLALPGIGPETADSILLYAAQRPSFVVDAYTRRIFTRLGMLGGRESYATVRDRFMVDLPKDVALFNEYHALIVILAKECCRKRQPLCPRCPLRALCRFAAQGTETN